MLFEKQVIPLQRFSGRICLRQKSGSNPESFTEVDEEEVQVEVLLDKILAFSTSPAGGRRKAQIRKIKRGYLYSPFFIFSKII